MHVDIDLDEAFDEFCNRGGRYSRHPRLSAEMLADRTFQLLDTAANYDDMESALRLVFGKSDELKDRIREWLNVTEQQESAHIAYSSAIITALRNDPGLSRTDAIYQTIPDYLTWKWSHRVGALRGDSHGGGIAPEGAYLEGHELDRDATPQWALDEFDALDETEREEIRERAESAELERR